MKNIIFYFSDQQRYDTFNDRVTPNIMELAKEGLLFDNAFTCQPVCGPARACLQTGLHASENGCYVNGIAIDTQYKDTLANILVGQGYDTAYIGKWHLASNTTLGTGRPYSNLMKKAVPKELRAGYNDYWLASDCLEFTSACYGGYLFDGDNNKVEFEGIRTDTINDYAIDYIKSKAKSDKPYFLFVSQLEPHHQNTSNSFECVKGADEEFQNYPIPEDLTPYKGDYNKGFAKYLASCKRLDKNFNDLVKCVKDSGAWDNTIIIYTSDHGCHFCTRNMEYKRSCHDASIHVPMLLTGGGAKDIIAKAINSGDCKQGAYQGLVSLLDIPPTILDIANAPIPQQYQGESLITKFDGKADTSRVYFQITESQMGRAIRTDRYTYSVKKPFSLGMTAAKSDYYVEDILYDNQIDKHQHNNLIRSKAYKSVKEQLKALLLEDIKKYENIDCKIKSKITYKK